MLTPALYQRTQAVFVLLGLTSLPLLADPKKLSSDMPKGSQRIEVIVQLDKEGLKNPQAIAAAGDVKRTFKHVPAMVLSLPAAAVEALSDKKGVQFITPNRAVTKRLEYAQPAVFADIAYSYGWTGQGIGVAVIDSGVTQHGDLMNGAASRIVYSQSFVPNNTSTADAYGHGTRVAGIIAGDATLSSGTGSTRKYQGFRRARTSSICACSTPTVPAATPA